MRACSRLSSTCGGHQHSGRASLPGSSPVKLGLEAVEDEQDRLSREVAQLKVQRWRTLSVLVKNLSTMNSWLMWWWTADGTLL